MIPQAPVYRPKAIQRFARNAFSWLLAASLPILAQAGGSEPRQVESPGSPFKTSSADKFLPVDAAFSLSSETSDGYIDLIWTVAPGYYLYKHKFSAQQLGEPSAGSQQLAMQLAPGIRSHDDYYGAIEIYYHQALARIATESLAAGTESGSQTSFEIAISYQGCAEAGLCYPVQTRQLTVSLGPTKTGISDQPRETTSTFE